MTKNNEKYYCEICWNLVEVIDAWWGELVCCKQPMVLVQNK